MGIGDIPSFLTLPSFQEEPVPDFTFSNNCLLELETKTLGTKRMGSLSVLLKDLLSQTPDIIQTLKAA